MIWHYDEAEAGRVGHPWLGDPAWNEENGSGFVTKLGEFVALKSKWSIISLRLV